MASYLHKLRDGDCQHGRKNHSRQTEKFEACIEGNEGNQRIQSPLLSHQTGVQYGAGDSCSTVKTQQTESEQGIALQKRNKTPRHQYRPGAEDGKSIHQCDEDRPEKGVGDSEQQ